MTFLQRREDRFFLEALCGQGFYIPDAVVHSHCLSPGSSVLWNFFFFIFLLREGRALFMVKLSSLTPRALCRVDLPKRHICDMMSFMLALPLLVLVPPIGWAEQGGSGQCQRLLPASQTIFSPFWVCGSLCCNVVRNPSKNRNKRDWFFTKILF